MTENKAKSKAKRASRASNPRPAPNKAKSPPKANRKSRPNVKAARRAAAARSDERNETQEDWRAAFLAEVRRLIYEADPEIVEERKWVKASNPLGVPIWSRAGIVCTGESYQQVVKLTFARGATLNDPRGLFNSSLEGNSRRAIDIHEGDVLPGAAFKALIRAAVAANLRSTAAKAKSPAKAKVKTKPIAKKGKPSYGQKGENGVVLLSGGNPQIAKGDGDAPVQAYIAAMPGWKRELGRRLDALIVEIVPNVRKAVKWNSPFFGIEGQGWFLSFHVFTRYVKVTLFSGTLLHPVPPGGTSKEARWIDIHEDDFDEAQMAAWIEQAADLPGWAT